MIVKRRPLRLCATDRFSLHQAPEETAQDGKAYEQAAAGLGNNFSFRVDIGWVHREINHTGEGQGGIGREGGSGAVDGDAGDGTVEVARGVEEGVVIDGVQNADCSGGIDPGVVDEAFDGSETAATILDGTVDDEVWENGGLTGQTTSIELEFNREAEDQVGKASVEGGLV